MPYEDLKPHISPLKSPFLNIAEMQCFEPVALTPKSLPKSDPCFYPALALIQATASSRVLNEAC